MPKILFIVKNKNEASSRFRVFAYFDQLQNDFTLHTFYAEYNNKKVPKIFRSLIKRLRFLSLLWKAKEYDLLYMQRPMSSDKSDSTFFEKLLVKINPHLIFDFDDALFVQNEPKIKSLVTLAQTCVCGNDYLAEFARRYNPNTVVIPTAIDTDRFQQRLQTDKTTITIGWTGTSGNYQFFTDKMINDIDRLLNETPNSRFLFICDRPPEKRFTFKYDYIPWRAESEIDDLQQIDIGLMPLIDSPWSRGKCGFKLIQYGAIGIASVASDVGVNADVILDTKSGYLVKDDDWYTPLKALLKHQDLAREMGQQAQLHIQRHYSIEANYLKLKEAISTTV
ncbi:glycosyltransferase family 4 protein [Sulfurovum sp.]|uniref:glycosyltransferase family 4 protein n=1 Tax=Sulfurovum sp. TaxID=1969726 RepID=UPI0035637351